MPIYEYRCPHGHTFERWQSMSAPDPEACDVCGASPVEKGAVAGAELVPAEPDGLPRGEVGRERLHEVAAAERQLEEGAETRQLARDRLHDLLLPRATRQVVLGQVLLVLPDARDDQGL